MVLNSQLLFQEIFSVLVPGSSASFRLVDAQNRPLDSSRHAVGVDIRVKMGSDSLTDLSHLSGGQKTVVALAFILAVQRCDPAPFFLLDEVDAALDSAHRGRVADWVLDAAVESGSQFICTTFRPELAKRASAAVGVKFANRVSHAEKVALTAALAFVNDDDDQE